MRCATCKHSSDIHYQGWLSCSVLLNYLAFILSDSDAAQMVRLDVPEDFGCIRYEESAIEVANELQKAVDWSNEEDFEKHTTERTN